MAINYLDQAEEYIYGLLPNTHSRLDDLERLEKKRSDICPSIGRITGQLLTMLIKMLGAKKVLECGTCQGISTIWLATACKEIGAKLVAIEASERLFIETKANLESTGLSSYVDLRLGKAEEVIKQLAPGFDLILQDAAKGMYLESLDDLVGLLRVGGVLVSDDVLFPIKDKVRKTQKDLLEAYNAAVFARKDLDNVILPVRDGLLISYKKIGVENID